jgi:urate oxidase
MSVLSWNRYGKSRIRLVKVRRAPARAGQTDAPHEIVDLTIDVQLEGAFEPVYVDGDNSRCLATDTMKNTVYALARQDPIDHVEIFALKLADYFYANPAVSHARISAFEYRWERLSADGRPHPHAFVQPGGEQWTTVVTRDAQGAGIASGLTNLVLLKTNDSAFAGFPRDEYTTLPETGDRVLATSVTASWTYRAGTSDFAARDGGDLRRAREPVGAAHPVRDGQRGAGRVRRRDRDHADAAEPASSARRLDAVRPRQPERDLRRDRSAVWPDRGYDQTVGRDGLKAVPYGPRT